MNDVAHVSLESVRSVYPSLTRLQCVVELEDFGKIMNRLVSLCVCYCVQISEHNAQVWSSRPAQLPSHACITGVRTFCLELYFDSPSNYYEMINSCFLLLFSAEASMVELWNERYPLPDNDFEFLEPILALRTSMLLTLVKLRANKSSSREGLINQARAYKDLATHLEMQAKVARRSHNPQV